MRLQLLLSSTALMAATLGLSSACLAYAPGAPWRTLSRSESESCCFPIGPPGWTTWPQTHFLSDESGLAVFRSRSELLRFVASPAISGEVVYGAPFRREYLRNLSLAAAAKTAFATRSLLLLWVVSGVDRTVNLASIESNGGGLQVTVRSVLPYCIDHPQVPPDERDGCAEFADSAPHFILASIPKRLIGSPRRIAITVDGYPG